MSTGGGASDGGRGGLQLTRWRDLLLVAAIAAVLVLLLLQWNYRRLPPFPMLSGLPAVLIGGAEAAWGLGLRRRLRDWASGPVGGFDVSGGRGTSDVGAAGTAGFRLPQSKPPDPLMVVRSLVVGKATALAGAAFTGLWLGVLLYVMPNAATVTAAAADRTSALVGLVGGVGMTAGALFLERCCRAPGQPS